MTIVEAIKEVLSQKQIPLTYVDIYKLIHQKRLYKFNTENPESIIRYQLRKHCIELNFASSSPAKYFSVDGGKGKSAKYKLYKEGDIRNTFSEDDEDLLPDERIALIHKQHITELKQRLLEDLKSSAPSFFENIVVGLLLKMGYGWDEEVSGNVVGQVGDEGIDGIIHQDKLGVEKIYIQAKKYTDKTVSGSAIREFIGSIDLKGAKKGIFITSSEFTNQAISHA